MQDNGNFSQNMETIFSDIQNFSKTDAVLGSPVSVGDKTLVPVMSVTLGYGSTPSKNGQGNSEAATNGLGLGARITTNAVVVIDKDSVSMLPTNEKSNMGQIIKNIPQPLMNSLPESLKNMGQSVLQKTMPQMGQQNNQQSSSQGGQQGSQQGTNQNTSTSTMSMQSTASSQQTGQQNKSQNNSNK